MSIQETTVHKLQPLPHQSFLYLIGNETDGYRFTTEPAERAVMVLEFVLPEKMQWRFNVTYAHRLKGDVLMLTDDDLRQIRNVHRAQIAA